MQKNTVVCFIAMLWLCLLQSYNSLECETTRVAKNIPVVVALFATSAGVTTTRECTGDLYDRLCCAYSFFVKKKQIHKQNGWLIFLHKWKKFH